MAYNRCFELSNSKEDLRECYKQKLMDYSHIIWELRRQMPTDAL